MVDVICVHKAPLGIGVLDRDDFETAEFVEWKKQCKGKVEIGIENETRSYDGVTGNINVYINDPRFTDSQPVHYVFFELKADMILYQLTFEELIKPKHVHMSIYCPYIPLQQYNVITSNSNVSTVTFTTRYSHTGVLNQPLTVYYDPKGEDDHTI